MSNPTLTAKAMSDIIITAFLNGEGEGTWKRTWNVTAELPTNASTGHVYQGMNRFFLMVMGVTYVATNTQWKALKAVIQWDKKPYPIPLLRPTFAPMKDSKGNVMKDSKGNVMTRKTGFAGYVAYASTMQVGWKEPVAETIVFEPVAAMERFIESIGVDLRHGGASAHYSPSMHYVQMPVAESFMSVTEYYRTLAHELVHWTAHATLTDRRDDVRKAHGTNAKAYEELIAEIGSCLIASELGIGVDPMFATNHIQYIKYWLEMMKGDSGIIIKAASQAEDAVNCLFKRGKYAVKPAVEVAA